MEGERIVVCRNIHARSLLHQCLHGHLLELHLDQLDPMQHNTLPHAYIVLLDLRLRCLLALARNTTKVTLKAKKKMHCCIEFQVCEHSQDAPRTRPRGRS
jgi:hypothetical protein